MAVDQAQTGTTNVRTDKAQRGVVQDLSESWDRLAEYLEQMS